MFMIIATGWAHAQLALKMGYSSAGVAQSLHNTIDRAGLWAKYNLDVKAIYFNNAALSIAALVAGHIDGALIGTYELPKILETGCCVNLADLEDLPIEYARFGVIVPTASLKARREIFRSYLQALVEGIYIFKTRPELPIALLKREGVKDAEGGQKKIAKALIDFPVPDEKAVQTALDFIGTPKAKLAQAKDYIDSSLLEEIKKSGFFERLQGE